jgi:hypothetical protein|tara:strand:- start:234 stop:425 length:192 start_codon:yes stop_codon:yes gene_type:complete
MTTPFVASFEDDDDMMACGGGDKGTTTTTFLSRTQLEKLNEERPRNQKWGKETHSKSTLRSLV